MPNGCQSDLVKRRAAVRIRSRKRIVSTPDDFDLSRRWRIATCAPADVGDRTATAMICTYVFTWNARNQSSYHLSDLR